MNTHHNALLLRAIRKESVERVPKWLMRQAGRYLPEYRQTRKVAGSFLNLCKTPELACEVTLQPLRRFKLDAAILFSDILTVPEAMGMDLFFSEGEGPGFNHPIRNESHIHSLKEHDLPLDYVMDAVSLIRKSMPEDLPLIGFSGSPWTLASYMVEGGGSKTFHHILKLLYDNPKALHMLLNKISNSVIDYLSNQVIAGVNVLMLFDTWGGILSTDCYPVFSLNYMKKIIKALKSKHPDIPVIIFTKGGGLWLELMAESGCDCVGLDWNIALGEAHRRIGHKVSLQGNLCPAVLLANPDIIINETRKMLLDYGHHPGLIFNLGHGLTPDIVPEHVKVLTEFLHDFRYN